MDGNLLNMEDLADVFAQLETIEVVDDDKKEVRKIEHEVEKLEETLEESEKKFS